MYEFDLHMHSQHSFDGIMSPAQMVSIAKRRGLAGIAVTDHNTIRGGLEARELNQDPNFLVIVGAEIQTEVGDILGLFLHSEIKSRRSREVVDEIQGQGGIAVLPHPFSHHKNITAALLDRLCGIEIYNGRDKQDFSSQIREQYALPHSLTMMGNSDAHLYWEIGRARTRIDLERLGAEQVREALSSGRCEPLRLSGSRSTSAVYLSKLVKRARRLL